MKIIRRVGEFLPECTVFLKSKWTSAHKRTVDIGYTFFINRGGTICRIVDINYIFFIKRGRIIRRTVDINYIFFINRGR